MLLKPNFILVHGAIHHLDNEAVKKMIDFIKKLFIPKYKPMGHFRPCLADTYSNEAQSRGLGSKNENDICPRCLGGGQNTKNKFYQTNSLSICQVWQSCFENT